MEISETIDKIKRPSSGDQESSFAMKLNRVSKGVTMQRIFFPFTVKRAPQGFSLENLVDIYGAAIP